MNEFVFIYWDELPEKDYQELQDHPQDKLLYGCIAGDNLKEAEVYGNNNTNYNKEVF